MRLTFLNDRTIPMGIALLMSLSLWAEETPTPDRARTTLAVEALSKLDPAILSSNPKVKEAVYRVLGQVKGSPEFVTLVKKFNLPNQQDGLMEIVAARGGDEVGAEAIRLVLAGGDLAPIQRAVTGTNLVAALKVVQALGAGGDGRALPLLNPLLTDLSRPVDFRKAVTKSLVRYQEGAASIVKLAREDALPADLRFMARSELSVVRWPEIKAAAAKALPAPEALGSEPLPSLQDLLKRHGDATRGQALFSGKATCATCHQVLGQGVNFGPDLSQVGSKLGKDAIYEAILDPSAGISFGYEAWLVTLKSGDEAFGLIASDTETDLSIKAPGGSVTSYKKSDIAKKEKQQLSVMPAGLQLTMTTQELVDVVEYLASLKKPN